MENEHEPEIIFYKFPSDKECCLYFTNIFWNDSSDSLWFQLHQILSEFGLLYNIYVAPSKFGNESGIFYAFARYFSQRAALRALSNAHKIQVGIGNQKIKVARLPRNNNGISKLRLSFSAISELISYYFGFHYWSSQILYLKREQGEQRELRYVCVVRVTTKDGLSSDGVGIGEAPLIAHRAEGRGMAYKMAQKFAVENAYKFALSKFVIIELANGKRLMEVDTTQPDPYVDPSLDDAVIKEIGELDEDPEEAQLQDFTEEVSSRTEELQKSEWIENLSDSALEMLLNS